MKLSYRLGQGFAIVSISVVLGLGAASNSYAHDDTLAEDLIILNELNKSQIQAQHPTNNQAHSTPRQSTAPTIAHDKLILNQPIIDEADILSDGEKSHLEAQLKRIYSDGLAQMAIVIVPTTNGISIFDYAYQVAKRWELGQKDSDDGILMVVAINDRKLHIVTGYGVEGVLPDVVLKRIIREDITPSFKTGEYAQGLSAGIARIDERLRADPETLARADRHAKPSTAFDDTWIFVPTFMLGLFLAITFGRLLGASLGAVGFIIIGLLIGLPLGGLLFTGLLLWLLILFFSSPSKGNIANHHTRRSGGGSFGGFGGGSFGGFGGGGGGFGGGGAGGSW